MAAGRRRLDGVIRVSLTDPTTIVVLVLVVAAVGYGVYRRFAAAPSEPEDDTPRYIVGDAEPLTAPAPVTELEPDPMGGPTTLSPVDDYTGPETILDPEE